jgi:interferon gamma-inducible protein 30
MKSSIILLLLLNLIFINSEKVKIAIFIESLCPFCNRYIKNSFKNFTKNKIFVDLADVEFYSFGNAYEQLKGGEYSFICQHGDNECYGNILQNCAQDKMPKEEFYKALICIEDNLRELNKNFDKLAEKCITDEDLLKKTTECLKGKEGKELHHLAFKATPENKQYVPWIVVDGKHDDAVENQILTDMNNYVCNLAGNKDLEGCKDYIKKRNLN